MRRGHRGCRSGTSKKNRSQKNARALRRRCCDVDTDDEFEKLPDTKRQPLFLQYLIDPPSDGMVSASAALKVVYEATNRRPLFLAISGRPAFRWHGGWQWPLDGSATSSGFQKYLAGHGRPTECRQAGCRHSADRVPTELCMLAPCRHLEASQPAHQTNQPQRHWPKCVPLAACSATYRVQNVLAFLLRRSARPPADGAMEVFSRLPAAHTARRPRSERGVLDAVLAETRGKSYSHTETRCLAFLLAPAIKITIQDSFFEAAFNSMIIKVVL